MNEIVKEHQLIKNRIENIKMRKNLSCKNIKRNDNIMTPNNNTKYFLSPRPNRGLLLQGMNEGDEANAFGAHLTQILKKQAQIDLETIRIKNADANYSMAADLRQMYNDLKAYVGRENADGKLL